MNSQLTAHQQFELESQQRVAAYRDDTQWQSLSRAWVQRSFEQKYMYNWSWMGRPVIQNPVDLMALQEIIWHTQPELIIETGVAHGGSLIFYASMLELLGKGEVLGIDIDIRPHNRAAIEAHPMSKRIQLYQGSSVDTTTIDHVRQAAQGRRTMICLDSMHTHDHVLSELNLYAPFVSSGCYLVVFDTVVEQLPKGFFDDRPWDVGNSPMTALDHWLIKNPEFSRDPHIDGKLLLSSAPRGWLVRR